MKQYYRLKEDRNILHTIRRRKANWIGHILRKNCLLSHIIEGKILETRRQGRRRKQLLDDLKKARRYWKLKEEAQDRTLRRTQFGRDYGSVARLLDFIRHCQSPLKSINPARLHSDCNNLNNLVTIFSWSM
jgi:hypothetical protein